MAPSTTEGSAGHPRLRPSVCSLRPGTGLFARTPSQLLLQNSLSHSNPNYASVRTGLCGYFHHLLPSWEGDLPELGPWRQLPRTLHAQRRGPGQPFPEGELRPQPSDPPCSWASAPSSGWAQPEVQGPQSLHRPGDEQQASCAASACHPVFIQTNW